MPQRKQGWFRIIDQQGRIFKPSPYNIPVDSTKLALFALNHILMMIETGQLGVEKGTKRDVFADEKEAARTRQCILNTLRSLETRERLVGPGVEYMESDAPCLFRRANTHGAPNRRMVRGRF